MGKEIIDLRFNRITRQWDPYHPANYRDRRSTIWDRIAYGPQQQRRKPRMQRRRARHDPVNMPLEKEPVRFPRVLLWAFAAIVIYNMLPAAQSSTEWQPVTIADNYAWHIQNDKLLVACMIEQRVTEIVHINRAECERKHPEVLFNPFIK